MTEAHWWQRDGVEPRLTFDGDGHSYKQVYSRPFAEEWEYVVVTFDDGTPRSAVAMGCGYAREAPV